MNEIEDAASLIVVLLPFAVAITILVVAAHMAAEATRIAEDDPDEEYGIGIGPWTWTIGK